MKNLALILLCVSSSGISFGQESFHETSRQFDIKMDFGSFDGTSKDNYSKDVDTIALSSLVLTPQMSWAVNKAISIGTSVAFSNYLDTGSATGSNPSLFGLDGNFLFDIHFVRAPKVDMMIGLKLGIAGIRYLPDDGTGDVYGSLGTTTDLHLMSRIYVSEKIAVIVNLGLPRYRFGQFGKNLAETYTLKFNGFSVGTGVTFKLLNQKTSGSARNK